MARPPVKIIGAGIGGTAAALTLARRGFSVSVHERRPALATEGAGFQIGPNGVKVLRALGVDAEPLGHLPREVQLRRMASGRLLATVPMGQTAEARWRAPMQQIRRQVLLEALYRAAQDAGAMFEFGAQDAQPEGLTIAADGMRSATRERLFDAGAPDYSGYAAWRGVVRGVDVPPAAQIFMGPERHLVCYPLGGGEVNFVAIERRAKPVAEDWDHSGAQADMLARFAPLAPAARAVLEACDAPKLWGLYVHPPMKTWVSGETALLGDAAHPMLPFMAQGATMALEDAWVLAACLAASPDAAGLSAYEAARKPRCTRMQNTSAGNSGIYHRSGLIGAALHAGMWGVGKLLPSVYLSKFDWIYGADVTASSAISSTR
ncbi:FAD-dependent monooxygenase [Paracoccaceae bacterium GXU_MW_L88]